MGDANLRRFERLIGSDAYNNTEEYKQRIKENSVPELENPGEVVATIISDYDKQTVDIKRIVGNSINKKV